MESPFVHELSRAPRWAGVVKRMHEAPFAAQQPFRCTGSPFVHAYSRIPGRAGAAIRMHEARFAAFRRRFCVGSPFVHAFCCIPVSSCQCQHVIADIGNNIVQFAIIGFLFFADEEPWLYENPFRCRGG